jgi:hypothetical protein
MHGYQLMLMVTKNMMATCLTCVLLLKTFAAAVMTSSPTQGGALPGFTNSWPMHRLLAGTGRLKRPCGNR